MHDGRTRVGVYRGRKQPPSPEASGGSWFPSARRPNRVPEEGVIIGVPVYLGFQSRDVAPYTSHYRNRVVSPHRGVSVSTSRVRYGLRDRSFDSGPNSPLATGTVLSWVRVRVVLCVVWSGVWCRVEWCGVA